MDFDGDLGTGGRKNVGWMGDFERPENSLNPLSGQG